MRPLLTATSLAALACLACLACPACSFEIPPVVFPPSEGGLPEGDGGPLDLARIEGDLAGDMARDLTMNPGTDGPIPDLSGPDMAMPPDMTKVPQILLAIDGRSPNVYRALAQPLLPNYQGQTVAHYLFDEAVGNSTLVDSSGAGNNLSAVGGMFTGNREQFTHIPIANGNGFKRVATEFKNTGFSAANGAAVDIDQEDFTVEAWFKLPPGYVARSKGPPCDPIVSKGISPGYEVCVTATGKLRMRVAWGGGGSNKVFETSASFTDGAWHLGTFVFGIKAQDAGAIYVDGVNHTPAKNDLSIAANAHLTANAQKFFVGGEGGNVDTGYFAGSLAEVTVHKGRQVTFMDHQTEYVAFGMPLGAGSPALGNRLSYTHASPICSTVAEDVSLGERVACYAGGSGGRDQVALSRVARADAKNNPDLLGITVVRDVQNAIANSERFDLQQSSMAMVVAQAATSPRGDQTADTITLQLGGYIGEQPNSFKGNNTVTYSVWLRGRNNGDYTYLRVTDSLGKEFKQCLVTLTTQWRRYSCTQTFVNANPQIIYVGPNAFDLNVPMKPMNSVTFDAWGAQFEQAAAPGPYVPTIGAVLVNNSAPVRISVDNAGSMFLNGAAGRVAVGFTPDPVVAIGSTFFDNSALPGDRRYLRRNSGTDLEGQVYDQKTDVAVDSVMTVANVDWTRPHEMSMAWSNQVVITGGGHTQLVLDGMGPVIGRAAAYAASSPAKLFLMGSENGLLQPAGTMQSLFIYDGP